MSRLQLRSGASHVTSCMLGLLLLTACSDSEDSSAGASLDDGSNPVSTDSPVDLVATAVSSDTVTLTWQDGPGSVDGYEIRRDGLLVGVSLGTRYLDQGVTSGARLYEVNGRTVVAVDGIDIATTASVREVVVPDAADLALQGGGRPLIPDGALDVGSNATLDALGRVALSGFSGDLFVVERLDADGSVAERRFLEGNETASLLTGADVWYVVGDDGEARPVIALDPVTLATRWTIESTTLELTGGCRFTALLADGALSCRGFADDTLRIGADGVVGPTSAGVRIPTGDRTSADDATLLVDVWELPAATVPDVFFPIYEWVTRDVVSGDSVDRGRMLEDDPAIDFPFTIDAVGVQDGRIVVTGDVLANGCLRVCVESLAVPPYVDGHYVARLDAESGRVVSLEQLPFGEPLGNGAGLALGDTLAFATQDHLSLLDAGTLSVIERRAVGGAPVALTASSLLTRVPGDDSNGVRWFSFVR